MIIILSAFKTKPKVPNRQIPSRTFSPVSTASSFPWTMQACFFPVEIAPAEVVCLCQVTRGWGLPSASQSNTTSSPSVKVASSLDDDAFIVAGSKADVGTWVGGWIDDERMDWWVDWWVDGWVDGWVDWWVDWWIDGWMDGLTDGLIDGLTVGLMDGRIHEWMWKLAKMQLFTAQESVYFVKFTLTNNLKNYYYYYYHHIYCFYSWQPL